MLYRMTELTSSANKCPHMEWLKIILSQISARFDTGFQESNQFPCMFARNAYARGNFLFIPIQRDPELDRYHYDVLADGLREYLADASTWDGTVNSAKPLLVIFEPKNKSFSIEDFHKTFIDSIQYLIDNDKSPWISNIPLHPDLEYWSMCFAGVQIFINVSHPLHHFRRSRNLGDALILVINPRERFDLVAGIGRQGEAIRERIRKNIDLYDTISRSPLLGHYQNGDYEWPQYMLPIDNNLPPLPCPLKFHAREEKDRQL